MTKALFPHSIPANESGIKIEEKGSKDVNMSEIPEREKALKVAQNFKNSLKNDTKLNSKKGDDWVNSIMQGYDDEGLTFARLGNVIFFCFR